MKSDSTIKVQQILRTYKAYPFRVDLVKYINDKCIILYKVVYRIARTSKDYYIEETRFEEYMCALAFFEDKVDYVNDALF